MREDAHKYPTGPKWSTCDAYSAHRHTNRQTDIHSLHRKYRRTSLFLLRDVQFIVMDTPTNKLTFWSLWNEIFLCAVLLPHVCCLLLTKRRSFEIPKILTSKESPPPKEKMNAWKRIEKQRSDDAIFRCEQKERKICISRILLILILLRVARIWTSEGRVLSH